MTHTGSKKEGDVSDLFIFPGKGKEFCSLFVPIDTYIMKIAQHDDANLCFMVGMGFVSLQASLSFFLQT